MKFQTLAAVALSGAVLAACTSLPSHDPATPGPAVMPTTQWDHVPQADAWKRAMLRDLVAHGTGLVTIVPQDIEAYCPAYASSGTENRLSFWMGLMSGVAHFESTMNPRAIGGGGKYFGLLQISPATARHVGCNATGRDLLVAEENLGCAVRIANNRTRSFGAQADARPVAAVMTDWGPMHSSTKRASIARWLSAQDYCRKPSPAR